MPVMAKEKCAREKEIWEFKTQSSKDHISRFFNLKIKAQRDKDLGFELGFIKTLRMIML